MKLELRRNDLLLRLPSFTEEISRTSHTGLSVATLQSQTYNPISGEVLQHSPFCSHVKVGDTVFFQIFTFTNAKERCYGDDNPDLDGYKPFKHIAWREDGVWYMIIRETDLYFIRRDMLFGSYDMYDKNVEIIENKPFIIPLNGYTIAYPIKKERYSNTSSTGLLCVDLRRENHKPNEAIIFQSSNRNLKHGMVVQTLRHCDITIEEELNCPILPEDFFIIETKNIISCTKP